MGEGGRDGRGREGLGVMGRGGRRVLGRWEGWGERNVGGRECGMD